MDKVRKPINSVKYIVVGVEKFDVFWWIGLVARFGGEVNDLLITY
jgi:hypothetical protein